MAEGRQTCCGVNDLLRNVQENMSNEIGHFCMEYIVEKWSKHDP